jgi:hypothetical protein
MDREDLYSMFNALRESSGQDSLSPCLEPADGLMAPDIQAHGQAASDGQEDGLALPEGEVANSEGDLFNPDSLRLSTHPTALGTGAAKLESDPFDLDSLRLSQDFASAVGVKRLITTIPVRKPSKEWFVRTHSDVAYWLQTAVLELKEERETYLVAPPLWLALASETTFSPRVLVTSINRQGVLFLWPIRLPGPDGKVDDWSRSALDAANRAKAEWVRIKANMSLGAYDVAVAAGQAAEPAWPDIAFQEIIKIAFRDKMISEWEHPVLRRLRGEV